MTLAALSSILEQSVEYGHVPRNAAAGNCRRLPSVKPRRTYLDRAEAIAALHMVTLSERRDGPGVGRSKP